MAQAFKLIRDEATSRLRTMTPEELEADVTYRPNRAEIRAWYVQQKRRGPGFTRAFKRGRQVRQPEYTRQRVPPSLDPLTLMRLRQEEAREIHKRAERAKRREELRNDDVDRHAD